MYFRFKKHTDESKVPIKFYPLHLPSPIKRKVEVKQGFLHLTRGRGSYEIN